MVGRRWVWHDITTLGRHALSDDVRRGMTSTPLDRTHGQQPQAWHYITALGLLARSVTSAWNDITALEQHTWSDDVWREMPSPPLENTYG